MDTPGFEMASWGRGEALHDLALSWSNVIIKDSGKLQVMTVSHLR